MAVFFCVIINAMERHKFLLVSALAFGAVLFFGAVAFAWIGPSQNPSGGSGSLYLDSNANLGIGTTNPTPTNLTTGRFFAIGTSSNPGLFLRDNDGWRYVVFVSSTTGYLTFYDDAASPAATRLYITTSGDIYATGNIYANAFVGALSGALNASNVSSGVFGSLQGNGAFAFPASLGVATTSQTGLPATLSVYGTGLFTGTSSASGFCLSGNCKTSWADYWVLNGSDLYASTTSWKVGVGTTTPSYTLTVSGQVYSTGSSTASAFCLGSTCQTSWSDMGQWTTAAGGIYYTGNASVGTTTVGTYPLFVSTSTDSLFSLHRTGATYPTIFKQGTDGVLIVSNANTDTLTLKDGLVGIGTTNPGQRLTVASSSGVSIDATLGRIVNLGAPSANSDAATKAYADSVGGGASYWALSGVDLYPTSTTYEVGIGTTTPAYNLTVVGTGYFSQPVIVGTPTQNDHAATKSYVDTAIGSTSSNYWTLSGTSLYPTSTTYKLTFASTTSNSYLNFYNVGSATSTGLNTAVSSTTGISFISSGFTGGGGSDTYWPGLVWYDLTNNPTKPKAAIYAYGDSGGGRIYLGTSGAYGTGITKGVIIKGDGSIAALDGGSLNMGKINLTDVTGGGATITAPLTTGNFAKITLYESAQGGIDFTVTHATAKPAFTFYNGSTVLARVANDGKLLLGSVFPYAKFYSVGEGTTTTLNTMMVNSANEDLFSIQNNGNVGVGTQNPRGLLDVISYASSTYPPTMTSNSTPSPYVASASTEVSASYAAWKAFNGSFTTDNAWIASGTTGNLTIDFGSGNAQTIIGYMLRPWTTVTTAPKTWTILGSNTGAFAGEQTTLDTQTNAPTWTTYEIRRYSFTNTTAYRYYRINITVNEGHASYVGIGQLKYFANNPPGLFVTTSSRVGIGTSTPVSKFVVQAPNALSTDSAMHVLDSSNASLFYIQNDGKIGIASSSPGYALTVLSSGGSAGYFNNPVYVGTPTADGHAATKAYVDASGGGNWTVSNGIIYPSTAGWSVGIGTSTFSSSTYKLYVKGDVFVGDGGGTTDVVVGSGSGKVDVGTVDPIYTIGGKRYATYMAGMIGVKEETTGQVVLDTEKHYVIDFKNLKEGSDLWLFAKTTNLKKNFDAMIVLLTPSFDGRVWYEKDARNLRLTIRGSSAGEVSYRLTAPRFDWQVWTNMSDAPHEGFNLDKLIFSNGEVDVKSLVGN